jgi:hypothetical protein
MGSPRIKAAHEFLGRGLLLSQSESVQNPPSETAAVDQTAALFDPHGWTGAAIANHSVISPATASLESDVDDWIHMPAVTLKGRFVAVYRAGR